MNSFKKYDRFTLFSSVFMDFYFNFLIFLKTKNIFTNDFCSLFDEYKIKDHYFWEFNWITPSKVILLERDSELSIANYDLNDKQEKQFLLEDSITKHKKKFKNLFEYLESAQSLSTELYNIQNSGSLDDLKKCIFNILDGEENG